MEFGRHDELLGHRQYFGGEHEVGRRYIESISICVFRFNLILGASNPREIRRIFPLLSFRSHHWRAIRPGPWAGIPRGSTTLS